MDAAQSTSTDTERKPDEGQEHSQQPKEPRVRSWTLFAAHWWLWEVGACLWSLILFVSVASILGVLDAIASTLCKASDIVFVAEGISQLKWTEFSARQNSLFNFDVYDQASRGAWGSLLLLARFGPKAIASLGAFVIILSLGFEASVQQSITYPIIKTPPGHAVAEFPIADGSVELFPKPEKADVFPYISANTSVAKAAWQFTGPKNVRPPNDMWCTGTICVWRNVTTAGICSKCNLKLDIFAQKKTIIGACLPGDDQNACPNNGSDFVFGKSFLPKPMAGSIQLYTTKDANKSYSFSTIKGFITTTYYQEWIDSQLVSECALYFCARRMNIDSVVGNVAINITEELPLVPKEKVSGVSLNISNEAREALSTGLVSTLTGGVFIENLQRTTMPVSVARGMNVHGFPSLMGNVSLSLTIDGWDNAVNSNVTGQTWDQKTVVKIRWRWLVLPAVVQLLAFIFFVMSMIASRRYEREGIWKSSSLATLLHTIGPEERDKLAKVETIYDMEQKSKKVIVQLKRNRKGYRQLVGTEG